MNLSDASLIDLTVDTIKENAKLASEFGRYFFSITASTVGVLATIEGFDADPVAGGELVVPAILLIVAMILAIILAMPRHHHFNTTTNLIEAHDRFVWRILLATWIWFVLWACGTSMGAIAVLR